MVLSVYGQGRKTPPSCKPQGGPLAGAAGPGDGAAAP